MTLKLPERIMINSNGEATIRDTDVDPLAVYHELAFWGAPEADILKKYPQLEPEDLVAIREYATYAVKSRDHDPISGRKIFPKQALRDGAYYVGRCRNATIARWCGSQNQFFHWREKFGNIFVETIKYPTDETHCFWDVFNPVAELPSPPFAIPFDLQAVFQGNPDDLVLFMDEMWGKFGSKHGYDIAMLEKRRGEMKTD